MSLSVKILALGLLPFLLLACQPQGQIVPTVSPAQPNSGPEITYTPSPTLTPEIIFTQNPPPPTATPETLLSTPQLNFHQFSAEVEQIIATAGGSWHIIIKEVDGETFYAREPTRRINIASVVKVPLALLFFRVLENNGIAKEDLRPYLTATGTGGRTFDQLLRAMLVKSEEDATQILEIYIHESSINLPAQKRAWGLELLDLEARRYTVEGVAEIFERFFRGDFINPTAREIILEYLSEYTPNDDLRLGALSNFLPDEFVVYNKRGSLLTPYVVADCAIVENPNGPDYILAVFAYQGDPETTYERLEAAITDIAITFAEQFSPSFPNP